MLDIRQYVLESIWIWFVLLAMALGVITLSYSSDIQTKDAYKELFALKQGEMIDEIRHTIVTYTEVLRSVRGLYNASSEVTRDEWDIFIRSLGVDENFPGIRTLGYAKVIEKQERTAFESTVRASGLSQFQLYPASEEEPISVVALNLKQFNGSNGSAAGFDMWSDEKCRQAMQEAVSKNMPVISKRMELPKTVQDERDVAGFMVVLPVYKKGVGEQASYTLEDVDGFVFGVFQFSKVLSRVNKGERFNFRVEIFDGPEPDSQYKMYVSHPESAVREDTASVNTQTLRIYDNVWTLRFTTLPSFAPGIDQYHPVKILVIGSLLCLLALVTLWSLRTSKHIAEVVAAERTAELAQSEEKFRSAMENSPVGMALIGPEGAFLKVNKALCQMLGYTEEELIKTDFQTLTHPDDLNADLEFLKQTLSGDIDSYKMEKRYIRKDGKLIWGLLSVSLLRDAEGGPLHFISQIQDITDMKNAQQRLEELNAELEEFSYRTSHDLRSPLTSSIGLLKLAQDCLEQGDDKKARTSISFAHGSLTKLEALLKDILDLARLKNLAEAAQPVDIGELVRDALEKFNYMENFERLDIQLDLKYDGEIYTRKTRVLMIVENMISNAIKYQDAAKTKSWIRIETAEKDGGLIMAIEDNGLGIPKDQQIHLFTMFKRFHPRVSFGSGLGLYMMRKSADVIGAKIRFIDKEDGSRFELFLPQESIRNKSEETVNGH